jgi:AcrR family transcriptional regulator
MARKKGDIDLRVVHAARARFLNEGVDGASLRKIAEDAGTSVGMVYYYFPTKDALFLAVVEEIYGQLLADLGVAMSPDVPVNQRFERLFLRFARMTPDEFDVMRIVLREVMISNERRSQIIERFTRGHMPLVIGTLMEGVTSGQLTNQIHPAAMAISTFALAVIPQILRRLVGETGPMGLALPRPEELAEALLRVVFHGIQGEKR